LPSFWPVAAYTVELDGAGAFVEAVAYPITLSMDQGGRSDVPFANRGIPQLLGPHDEVFGATIDAIVGSLKPFDVDVDAADGVVRVRAPASA
jgi:hypothetical protein